MANINEVMGTDVRHYKDYVKTSSGDRATITGLDNYKEALFRRLITTPGALVHRPNYGVGVKRFLNSPATLSRQRDLARRIEEQFMLDPRTEKVSGVSIAINNSRPDLSIIVVRVKPVGYDEIEMKFEPFGA